MPLTLSPELETQLSAVAAQRGLAPIDALAQLLSEAAANLPAGDNLPDNHGALSPSGADAGHAPIFSADG